MSFGELYLAPSLGATVHLADDVEVRDGRLLAALLAASGASFLNATPTTWSMLLESDWPGSPFLRAASGGEAVTPRLAALLGARVHGFWNFYGPTETTDISIGGRLRPGTDPVPIGMPAANTTLHVLDAWGQPVLSGFPGELYIGGVGVADGYINRPELTASRFVILDTPAGPVRTYRTGDRVRSLPEGGLEFLGRVDHQIKLRGYRIELGEIEALIRATPGVALAAAVLLGQPSPRIAAFYSCASPVALAPDDVRSALRAELPAYMVPALIRRLDVFPMTVSGKIDRKALEALGGDLPERAPSLPLSTLESEIHQLFAEVLDRTDFGADDNFFDLGGHSLSAVRLSARLNARFTPVFPLRDFFGAPSVRAVAAAVATRERQPAG
jgi:acyl-coenzyme A synthetase/AMP-(fatty) acid ligase/acyl carrier protein